VFHSFFEGYSRSIYVIAGGTTLGGRPHAFLTSFIGGSVGCREGDCALLLLMMVAVKCVRGDRVMKVWVQEASQNHLRRGVICPT
jgi:hypothetical protein